MNAPTRPALRYHGGKFLLAPWIIQHLPAHRVYVEPFGGAASVLLRKERSYAEVYNDLDGEVVDYFRVLRERAPELEEALRLTPFAREEFSLAYEPTGDRLERARRLVVRSFMGFGSDSVRSEKPTGFRANPNKSGSTPAHDWSNLPSALRLVAERLRGVVVENRDGLDVMAKHDASTTLHYVDPPYVAGVRTSAKRYRFELSDSGHETLAKCLHGLSGMVVLSGYPSALYDDLFGSWHQVARQALADGARPRTEVLWFNDAAWERLHARVGVLPLPATSTVRERTEA